MSSESPINRPRLFDGRILRPVRSPSTWTEYGVNISIVLSCWFLLWTGIIVFSWIEQLSVADTSYSETDYVSIKKKTACVFLALLFSQTRAFLRNLQVRRKNSVRRLSPDLPARQDPFVGGHSAGAPLEFAPQNVRRHSNPAALNTQTLEYGGVSKPVRGKTSLSTITLPNRNPHPP